MSSDSESPFVEEQTVEASRSYLSVNLLLNINEQEGLKLLLRRIVQLQVVNSILVAGSE